MNIGIDIDGVIAPYGNFRIDYGTKLSYLMKKCYLKDPKAYDVTELFDVDSEFRHKYTDDFEKIRLSLPAVPFASEVISILHKQGHKIFIITHRRANDSWFPENMRKDAEKITMKWLKKNHIHYDKIIFSASDKGQCCEDNKIDIMLEDAPYNIRNLKGKTHVLIFNDIYNDTPEFKDFDRVYSWYDALIKIEKLNEIIDK